MKRGGSNGEGIQTPRFNFWLFYCLAQCHRTSPSPAHSMGCGYSAHFAYIYLNISITGKAGLFSWWFAVWIKRKNECHVLLPLQAGMRGDDRIKRLISLILPG